MHILRDKLFKLHLCIIKSIVIIQSLLIVLLEIRRFMCHQFHCKGRDVFDVDIVDQTYFGKFLHQRVVVCYWKHPSPKLRTELDV